MNGKIFISYSWAEPSGSIVNNWLVPAIKAAGINCLVDKEVCGYNANIDKFEADIPKAAKVVLVLSPSFFTSLECMFEAALAVSKCDVEKQVYVINLPNYNFRKDEEKWLETTASLFESQKKDCDDLISKLADAVKGPYKDKLRKINIIISNLGELWRMLGSKNSGDFKELSENNFKLVCEALKRSLEEAVCKDVHLSSSSIEP
jgi:hypothetical protein